MRTNLILDGASKVLENERQEINEIDAQLTALFEKRLAVAHKIATVKYANKLPLTNVLREQEVITQQTAALQDATLAPYLTDWYRTTMLIAKQYQAHVIKGLQNDK